MKQGDYILLAWHTGEAFGGLNDCCGWFEDVNFAYDFFRNSSHCKGMSNFQIINTVTWNVIKESNDD